MERHERSVELPHITPYARRIAVVVAVLAALLAVSEVFAENRIAHVITDETKIAHLNATVELDAIADLLGKPHGDHAAVRAEIGHLEADQLSAERAHERLEFAVILLQLGIVLASISALLGVRLLLRGGMAVGVGGAAFLVAGLLA